MQKALEFIQYTYDEAKEAGFPTHNRCNHYVVDMSHLKQGSGDWMNTIVVKLPFGNFLTICLMQTGFDEVCMDTVIHGDNVLDKRMLGMDVTGVDEIRGKNAFILVVKAKGGRQ